jgi:hypothetical protein
MGPTSGDFREEFRRRVDEMNRAELAELGDDPRASIPDEAHLWAALTPGWTETLADLCRFPGVEGDAHRLFERMVGLGLLRVYEVDQQPDDVVAGGYYVMAPNGRADVLQSHLFTERPPSRLAGASEGRSGGQSPIAQALRVTGRFHGETERGAAGLLRTTTEIGQRMQEAGASVGMPRELQRWCQLAVHAGDPAALARVFESQVGPSIEKGDAAGIRDWIETARPLAALLEYAGETRLSIAIGWAGRALELLKRRQADFRRLAAFHRREEQVEVVRRLLEGPDDLWALHLIGPGGVGKTMIVRYITCLLAHLADSPCAGHDNPFGEEVVVARVDFDFLTLDYPRLHPGLLLEHFAQELRAAGNSHANRLFDDASRAFEEVRKELQANRYRLEGRTSGHPLMIEGVRRYIDALRSLDRRVLLVLDTCEELIKADPEGEPKTTLDETFRMLSALHDGADTLASDGPPARGGVERLRVIFSGRRLLAGAGAGWRTPDPTLPVRPFLRLHEIRGFTHDEARVYLAHQKVPDDLIDAVIQASSPDTGTGIRIDPPQVAGTDADVPRCNPYQLRQYMDWAREERRPMKADLLSAAAGNFVELRIIQRLGDPELARILPLAALLGHFDAPTLGEAAGLDAAAAERLFDALAAQEWTGTHRSGAGDRQRVILDVVPNVRDALVAYFAARREPSGSLRARAADAMERLTLDPGRDLGALEWTDWDAALRAMEHDLTRGAEWWARVEERLLLERDPEWVLRLLGPLTEKDGAARLRDPTDGPDVPPENRLRPLVLATQARAQLHVGRAVQLAGVWREVADKARASLDRPAFGRLYRRALAGQIAAARFTPGTPSPELVEEFWLAWRGAREPFASQQEAASAMAAVETLVDAAEIKAESDPGGRSLLALPMASPDQAERTTSGPRWLADAIEAAHKDWPASAPGRGQGLLAFSCALAGRALRIEGDQDSARRYLLRSVQDTPADPSSGRPLPWADWPPPADLAARLRLELARTAYPGLLSADETLQLLRYPAAAPPNADVDRLRSMLLQLRLAVGVAEPRELASLGWADAATGSPVLRTEGLAPVTEPINAHRLVPPLFVSVCRVLAAAGRPREAIRQLRYVGDNRSLFDRETVWHAERALLQLIRRLRLNEANESTETTLPDSARVDDVILIWSLSGLEGPKLPDGSFVAAPPNAGGRAEHGYWQACYALDSASAATTVTRGHDALVSVRDLSRQGDDVDFDQATINLDLIELRLVAAAYRLELNPEPPELYRLCFDPARWIEQHPDRPAEALTLLLRSWVLDETDAETPSPSGTVDRTGADRTAELAFELTEQLGQRRAAELAFELAEQLGQRLPERAVPLLHWATEQFSDSGDPLGGFLASTLAAFLEAGGRGAPWEAARFRASVETALRHYEELGSGLAAVPDTAQPPEREHLEGLAEALTEADLEALGPPWLRPWLVRLVACLVRRRELSSEASGASASAPLRAWIERRCGVLVEGTPRLPTEWSGFFAERAVPIAATATQMPGKGARPAGASLSPYLIRFAVILAAVGTGFALWSWAEWVLTLEVVSGLGPVERIGISIVTLLSIGAAFARFGRRLRLGWVALLVEIDLRPPDAGASHGSIGSGRAPSSRAREVRVEATFRRPRLAPSWPPYRRETERVAPETVTVLELDRYETLAEAAPPGLIGALQRASGGIGGLPVVVRLSPRSELHAVCWEALFALALPGAQSAPPGKLPSFSRTVEASRSGVARHDGPYLAESLALDEFAGAIVRRALERGRQSEVRWSVVRVPGEDAARAQVVHVIGLVVPEGSSSVLQLTPEPSGGSQLAAQKEMSSPGPERSPRTFRPAELRRQYPRSRVCIVQGYPELEPGAREDSDRRSAALTRGFAAEIARDGVTVIVVPPLETAVASQVWAQLNEALPGYLRRGIAALRPAVARMQSTIVDASRDRRSGWELALDLCVYDAPTMVSGDQPPVA